MLDFSQPVNVTCLAMTGLSLFNVEKNTAIISLVIIQIWLDVTKLIPGSTAYASIAPCLQMNFHQKITQQKHDSVLTMLRTDWHMPTYLISQQALSARTMALSVGYRLAFTEFNPTWIAFMQKVWVSTQWTLTKSIHAERIFWALVKEMFY